MEKVTFWIMVGIAAIVMIYLLKTVATMSNVQGLKDFASAI